MRILVVCQHYWPEPYPLQDVCEELVHRGHEVHLITDVPNYPMGIIYPEYKKGRNREQVRNGVHIKRTFTIGRRKNVLFRFLNYFSYAASSTLYALRLKEDYDVVFTNQSSPVTMSVAAVAYAKKHKKKVVLYCMDLWPASLAAGGVREGSLIYRAFGWISKWVYKGVDRILITSEMFREYFCDELQVQNEKLVFHPQYAVPSTCEPVAHKQDDTVDLVFTGNIGAAQSITTILQAAKLLEDRQNLRWHIVGDGSELENLRREAEQMQLGNVIFHGRRPAEEMPKFHAMADAMLVTLTADPFISRTLPGKVQAYMAAGKPIIGAANGEIPNVIQKSQCGFCAQAEDAQGLATAVAQFMDCEDRARLGDNSKAFYESNFSRDRFMNALERELLDHAAMKV
jgi:glycosyltransferase involved in cell wall biosynthesis